MSADAFADPAMQEQHEQNLRDLKLIREDQGWALSMVQRARERDALAAENKQLRAVEKAARRISAWEATLLYEGIPYELIHELDKALARGAAE